MSWSDIHGETEKNEAREEGFHHLSEAAKELGADRRIHGDEDLGERLEWLFDEVGFFDKDLMWNGLSL